MNHTQQTANAKIIAELFSLSSEIYETTPPSSNNPGAAPQAPLELSQQDAQTLLHIVLATITHFFVSLDRFLEGIDDPRVQSKITYSLNSLLFIGIFMYICHLGARRQIALKCRGNAPSAANFFQLFGIMQAPHGDTLNHAFKGISVPQVQECVSRLVETLIRKKVLEGHRLLDCYYVIAIDGTQLWTLSERHCKHCLTRVHKDGTIEYYHYVLEAKLVTGDGFAFSIMTEFVENPEPDPTMQAKQTKQAKETKQDCELKAFYRLAKRLKDRFPRLPICLSLDALFDCGPVFTICRDYNWRYAIVLKEKDLPSVYKEFIALHKLQPEGKLKERIVKPIETKRDFRWVNGIEYNDTKGRKHLLNVIELNETKARKKDGQLETKRFMWVTDLESDKGNVREIAQTAGRDRWKIENQGFNSQKRGGFALEHLYSHDYNSQKVFYYLLQMAHLFFQLIVRGSLFKKYFPRGFGSLKNFAGRLIEAWRNGLLALHILDLLSEIRVQIRFNTS